MDADAAAVEQRLREAGLDPSGGGVASARGGIREATIAVKVIRADGTEEDHGVVSYYHKNPIKRLLWRLKHGDLRR
jgi:hypothetical protein